MQSDHSELKVLCEIVRRIEEKVDKQNGSVARLVEWRIQHEEHVAAQKKEIDGIQTKLGILDPVIATMRYPRVVVLAVLAILFLSVKDAIVPIFSILGI